MIKVIPFSNQTEYALYNLDAGIFGVGYLTAMAVFGLREPALFARMLESPMGVAFVAAHIMLTATTARSLVHGYEGPAWALRILNIVWPLALATAILGGVWGYFFA